MTKLNTAYEPSTFFDYHTPRDKQCDACYVSPLKQSCGGLLHNHINTVNDNSNYVLLWQCDECGEDHQNENEEE